jgi:enamine deaminase RidA (YjgF/YER057c/UK114 family)
MPGRIDARLRELGIEIPDPVAPMANYVGHVRAGDLVFVAGQVPIVAGEIRYVGKLGDGVSLDDGRAAARICAVNILGQLKVACGGDLDRVRRIVKLCGFVNSTPDFTQQPQVINGASDLMVEVFGERGKHARAAVSSNSLPAGSAVEIDAVAEVD